MDNIKRKYVMLRKTGAFRDMSQPVFHEAGLDKNNFDFKVEIDEVESRDMDTIRRDNTILTAAPSMPVKLIQPMVGTDSTPGATSTWGLDVTKAVESNFNGTGIKVAVLDTGIDENHEAFRNVRLNVRDFTNEGGGDQNGHGTHCAGTIFGGDVNGVRIGIAKNVEEALIGKVLGQNGGGTETILNAVNWAVAEGANVISMSLGIDFPGYVDFLVNNHGLNINAATSMALEGYRSNVSMYQALAELVRQRSLFVNPCLIIAASGNESRRPNYEISVAPPAASDGIISVGALDANMNIASFSNIKPDISGPGVDIVSAKTGGGLSALSGTSMATPHVSGVAALWAQRLKDEGRFTIENFRAELLSNVHSNFLNFNQEDFGAGLTLAPRQGV